MCPPVYNTRLHGLFQAAATNRFPIHSATFTVTALPRHLYRAESLSPTSVNPEGKPCKRSHSMGVSRLTPIIISPALFRVYDFSPWGLVLCATDVSCNLSQTIAGV